MKRTEIAIAAALLMSAASLAISVTAYTRAPTSHQVESMVREQFEHRAQQRVAKVSGALDDVRRDFGLPPREAETLDDVIDGVLEMVEGVSGGNRR